MASNSDFVVTTLGTGTPVYNPLRCSQSILVEAANFFLLFDTGRGVAQRLVQAGIAPAQIDRLFFYTLLFGSHSWLCRLLAWFLVAGWRRTKQTTESCRTNWGAGAHRRPPHSICRRYTDEGCRPETTFRRNTCRGCFAFEVRRYL